MNSTWSAVGLILTLVISFYTHGGLHFFIGSDQKIALDAHCERTINTIHDECQKLIAEYQQMIKDKEIHCQNSLDRARSDEWIAEKRFNRSSRFYEWNMERVLNQSVYNGSFSCYELKRELERCAREIVNSSEESDLKFREMTAVMRVERRSYQRQLTQRERGRRALQKSLDTCLLQMESCTLQQWTVTPWSTFIVAVVIAILVGISQLQGTSQGDQLAMHRIRTEEALHDRDGKLQRLLSQLTDRDARVLELETTVGLKSTELGNLQASLEEKEQNMQTAILQLQQENQLLNKQLAAKKDQVHDLNSTTKELTEQLRNRDSQIEKLGEDNKIVQGEIETVMSELDKQRDRNRELETMVEQKNQCLKDTQHKIAAGELQLESTQQELEKARQQVVGAQQLQQQYLSKTESVMKELRNKQAFLAGFEQEVWQKEQEKWRKDLTIQQKDNHIDLLKATLMRQEREIAERELLLLEKDERLRRLIIERDYQSSQSVSELITKVAFLKEELERKNKDLQTRSEVSKRETKAQQRVKLLKEEKQKLQSCLDELQNTCQHQIKQKGQEAVQALQKASSLEKERDQLWQQLSQLQESTQKTKGNLDTLEALKENFERQCIELRKQCDLSLKSNRALRKQCQRLTSFQRTTARQTGPESPLRVHITTKDREVQLSETVPKHARSEGHLNLMIRTKDKEVKMSV